MNRYHFHNIQQDLINNGAVVNWILHEFSVMLLLWNSFIKVINHQCFYLQSMKLGFLQLIYKYCSVFSIQLYIFFYFDTENSKSDYVMFQAATTIKESVVREWMLLEASDIESLRSFLLRFITQHITYVYIYISDVVVSHVLSATTICDIFHHSCNQSCHWWIQYWFIHCNLTLGVNTLHTVTKISHQHFVLLLLKDYHNFHRQTMRWLLDLVHI